MKLSKIFLNERLTSQTADFIRGKVSFKNVIFFNKVAKCFRQRDLAAETFSYIQRCFTLIVRTPNFAELEITEVKRILSSSELEITSELEVAAAADAWLKHKYDERKKFSKDLLLTVRLNLLPDSVLNKNFQKSNKEGSFTFQRNEECLDLAVEILRDKKKFYQNNKFLNCNTRCCRQKEFNIQIYGRVDSENPLGSKIRNIVVDSKNPRDFQILSYLPKYLNFYKPVVVKHEIYVLYRTSNKYVGVCKYSSITKTWKKVTVIYKIRNGFSACAFMDKIYIVGGSDKNKISSKSCIELNTTDRTHTYTQKMYEGRTKAAVAVFEERLVVAGGYPHSKFRVDTRSVEAFEHAQNTWTRMPSMIYRRSGHSLVALKNKLFAFGRMTKGFEVYDSHAKKFAIFNYPYRFVCKNELGIRIKGAVLVGGKIIILRTFSTKIIVFDPDNGKWSEKICEATEDLVFFECLKLPKI